MRRMVAVLLFVLASGPARNVPPVANPALLSVLTAGQKKVLAASGFVAAATAETSMYRIIEDACERRLPVLVTTDLTFHALDLLADHALHTAETLHFAPNLRAMLRLVLSHQLELLSETKEAAVRQALLGNIAFLSVPYSFLENAYKAPRLVAPKVAAELALIEARQRSAVSEILGTAEDFSAYKLPDRYTRDPTLGRYYQARTYLGRALFLLPDAENPGLGLRLTRRAILLAEAIETAADSLVAARESWRRVAEPLAHLSAQPEEPGPREYARLARALRGRREIGPWLASDSNLAEFVLAAESIFGPEAPRGMRIIQPEDRGSRLPLLDSRFPAPLHPVEAMAALGSWRARSHLARMLHPDKRGPHLARLDSLADRLRGLTVQRWNENLPSGWQYALKLQLEPAALSRWRTNVAAFGLSDAYQDKELATACAAWTELQADASTDSNSGLTTPGPGSGADAPLGPAGKPDIAYVEPKPDVFEQLAWLATDLSDRLTAAGFVHPEVNPRLEQFASACRRLAAIATEGLIGVEPSEDKVAFCRNVGGMLRELTTFDPGTGGPVLEPAPLTRVEAGRDADGMAVDAAVGRPWRMYAVIPFYGEHYLAVGACYSYYESAGKPPDRLELKPPPWTASFLAR